MAVTDHHTLLLRLAGPLQSWGTSSRYTERDTGSEPSKSGVVGILAAALGRPRTTPVDDLARLRMGVRVDREGVPGYDFQSAGASATDPGIAIASDTPERITQRIEQLRLGTLKDSGRGRPSISRRHFLQDAVFLVGLEGPDLDQLYHLDQALRFPIFPIGLGRRSYVPSLPITLSGGGVRPGVSLQRALQQTPPLIKRSNQQAEGDVLNRYIFESSDTEQDAVRMDQPVGAAFAARTFGLRPVVFKRLPLIDQEPSE